MFNTVLENGHHMILCIFNATPSLTEYSKKKVLYIALHFPIKFVKTKNVILPNKTQMVAPSFVCYDFESIAFVIYLQSNRCLSSWHQIPSLMGGILVYQFNTLYKIHIRKFFKKR